MPDRPPFPIPEDIHAEPFCLCIQVPNDPTWKRVVAGLLDELNQWYNWQRDEARSGRECAHVWRALYAEIDWTTMSCCCEEVIRQYRYTELGVLQVSVDGGLTWTDDPNADVRNNSTIFPPIPGGDGDDKKCSAATGAANLVKEQVGDQLTDDMGRYTLNQLVTDWVGTMIGTSNPFQALVTVVANQIFALVISAVRAALTDDVYHKFACELYCHMASDGSFSNAQWAALRSGITSHISGVAGIFLEHLIYLLGAVGTTNVVRSAPDASGDCSDCDCPPEFAVYVSDLINPPVKVEPEEDGTYNVVQSGTPTGDGFYWIVVQFKSSTSFPPFSPCATLTDVFGVPSYNEKYRCGDGVVDPLSACNAIYGYRFTSPGATMSFRVAGDDFCT